MRMVLLYIVMQYNAIKRKILIGLIFIHFIQIFFTNQELNFKIWKKHRNMVPFSVKAAATS